jgi:phosphatidyl-myo-inositol dimannoside synthase
MPMRLLALVGDAFGGRGGIAQYNRDLLTALAGADRDSRILVLVRHGPATPAMPPGVAQLARGHKAGYVLTALRLALTAGRFDAVFCGHLNLASLADRVARLACAPLWVQVHGSEAWTPLSPARMRAAERAALVTSVSRHTRRRFLGFCPVDPGRVRVLPDTVGRQFGPGPKLDRLLDRHRLRGSKVLLTVGRLAATEREKGHDRVLAVLPELVATNPDIVYLVVGDGDDRPRLEELARRLGVADHVRFAGVATAAELPDYYRAADLFVMPSTQEGFGIVFLEAAASGLPVIGGDRDASADPLADGAFGRLVDPADSGALLAAIRAALIAPASAGHMPPVARFGFDDFARHARDLAATHLAPAMAA